MKVPKANNAIHQKTVDTQHTHYLEKIRKTQIKLTNLKDKITALSDKITDLEKRRRDGEEIDVNEILELKDEKIDAEQEYKNLKNEYDEKSYLENNANILYNYYDLVENGQIKQSIILDSSNNKDNNILSYFMNPNPNPSSHINKSQTTTTQVADSRGNLLEKYMMQTDHNFIKFRNAIADATEKCEHCNSNDITVMLSDGYQFCNQCFTIDYIITDHDKPSYRDPPKEISYFAYKRINHYSECPSGGQICILAC